MLRYDNELDTFVLEIDNMIFSWDEEPEKDYESQAEIVAKNYKTNLFRIIEFMYDDIQEMYGDINLEDIKEKLGRPNIDINNGQVTYYEQSFDDIHLFSFEFLDNEFNDIQYFSIDG